jgi:hypothetical protein
LVLLGRVLHNFSKNIMNHVISILGENGKSDGQVDAVDAHFRDDNHWASILTTDSDASAGDWWTQ